MWGSEVSSLVCAGRSHCRRHSAWWLTVCCPLACCEGGVATVMKKQRFCLYSHVNSLNSWRFAVLIYGGTECRDSSGLSKLASTKSKSVLKGVKMWLYHQGGARHAEQTRWCCWGITGFYGSWLKSFIKRKDRRSPRPNSTISGREIYRDSALKRVLRAMQVPGAAETGHVAKMLCAAGLAVGALTRCWKLQRCYPSVLTQVVISCWRQLTIGCFPSESSKWPIDWNYISTMPL